MTSYIETRKTLWLQADLELMNAQELEQAVERYEKLAQLSRKEAIECRRRADDFRKGAEAVGKLENEQTDNP